jgi:RNA polymerase sigma-70 factor, ECF subfamily
LAFLAFCFFWLFYFLGDACHYRFFDNASTIPNRMQPSAELLSNQELVARIRQGDAEAEAVLYEKFYARVYFTALSETHSKEDAEDVRAETFLRVIQALRQDKLRSADALPSFIVGITLNVLRELVRQKYRVDSLEDHEYDIASDSSLESALLDAETSRALEEAARELKPREQQFLRMYYYEELPKEEIARKLGIKEERLRLIKSRALQRFKEIYKKMTKP